MFCHSTLVYSISIRPVINPTKRRRCSPYQKTPAVNLVCRHNSIPYSVIPILTSKTQLSRMNIANLLVYLSTHRHESQPIKSMPSLSTSLSYPFKPPSKPMEFPFHVVVLSKNNVDRLYPPEVQALAPFLL